MSEPQTDLERTTVLFQYLGDSIDALERFMKAAWPRPTEFQFRVMREGMGAIMQETTDLAEELDCQAGVCKEDSCWNVQADIVSKRIAGWTHSARKGVEAEARMAAQAAAAPA